LQRRDIARESTVFNHDGSDLIFHERSLRTMKPKVANCEQLIRVTISDLAAILSRSSTTSLAYGGGGLVRQRRQHGFAHLRSEARRKTAV
jgi:hypothetical protein